MKKYKLIREYPGSPKLGFTVKFKTGYPFVSPAEIEAGIKCNLSLEECQKHPEFWEEVVEKDYEILSFKRQNSSHLFTLRENGNYFLENDYRFDPNGYFCGLPESYHLDNVDNDYEIYSVKRLSDGEVFTVGDRVRISKLQHDGSFIIDRFYFDCNNNKLLCDGKCTGNGHVSITKIEKVKKPFNKDYEILSFYAKNISGKGDDFVDPDYIWYETSKGSGKWSRQGYFTSPYNTQEITNHSGYGIHSVRRKSDGGVFTVGDKAITKHGNYGNITEFELKYNKIYITTKSGKNRCYLDDLKPIKKPLFTTEDGVDIFEGDEVTSVNLDTLKTHATTPVNTGESLKYGNYKHFSTKEAAEEYINLKKPYLSNKDVLDEIEKCTNIEQLKKVFTNKVAY